MLDSFRSGLAAGAVAICALTGAAEAASVGGATLDFEGLFTATPTATPEAGADVVFGTSFTAVNMISDFDAVLNYEASALLSVGAPGGPLSPVFAGSAPLGPVSINGLIGDVGAMLGAPGLDVDQLLALAAPVLFGPDDMGSFVLEGVEVFYDVDVTTATPSLLEGTIAASAFLTESQIGEAEALVALLLGPVDVPEAFAFALSLEISPTAIPVPASLPLALAGLAAFGLVRLRARRAA